MLKITKRMGDLGPYHSNEVIAAIADMLGAMIGLHAHTEQDAREMLSLVLDVIGQETERVISHRNKEGWTE
jgi:low affinity Fe/Cu permease